MSQCFNSPTKPFSSAKALKKQKKKQTTKSKTAIALVIALVWSTINSLYLLSFSHLICFGLLCSPTLFVRFVLFLLLAQSVQDNNIQSPILGDPGAVSRDDRMFVVKVYCKIDLGPGSPRMPIPHRVPLNQLGSKASGIKRRTSHGNG